MRAWQQDEYGDASVVRLMEVPEPAVRANEVLIAPAAVGVNNGDTRIMQGEPLLVRPFFGIRRPKERVRGMAVAGTVVAMGREAGGFAGSRWHALFDVCSPIGVGRRQWVLARAMVDLPVGERVVDRTLS